MASPARTIHRRDAAVTAGIAGAVLVILGYASGLGLRHPGVVAASMPEQPAPTVAPATPPALVPPVAAAPPAITMPMTAAVAPPPATTSATALATPTPSPSAQPAPVPTTPAAPTPTATTCPPGVVASLVGGLPVVGGVTSLVSGLLAPVLGATPASDGGLGCAVQALVGTTCCQTPSATRTSTGGTP